MKIGVFSDAHMRAYPAFAGVGERGVNTRLSELRTAARAFLRTCQEHDVTYVIHNGDWFDQKHLLDGVVLGESLTLIEEARGLGLRLTFNHGNHEEAAGGIRSTLEAFAGIPHVGTVLQDATEWGERVIIVPYVRDRETLLARLDDARRLRDATPGQHVLFLHAQIDGARTSSEYRVPGTITLAEIRPEEWGHVFCGHIHEPQQLAPNVHIIGSMAQRSFADEGRQRRGFIVDTETGAIVVVLIPGPRFRTVTINSQDDLAALVPSTDPLVTALTPAWYQRVRLGTTEITPGEIGDLLGNSCAGYTVVSTVPTVAPVAVVGGAIETNWHDATRRWIERVQPNVPLDTLVRYMDEILCGEGATA